MHKNFTLQYVSYSHIQNLQHLSNEQNLLNNSNSTVIEWTRETTKNIEMCKQQIKCAMSLRSYVEILFKQVVEDISDRFDRTNEQFRKRMEEMRYAKMKLEGLHCGTANQVENYLSCLNLILKFFIIFYKHFSIRSMISQEILQN
jgi:hypothetical protein